MGVEVLIPDFNGEAEPLRTVMAAGPDILNHNVETVARLQKPVRKRARYDRSLGVLERAKAYALEFAAAGAGAAGTVAAGGGIAAVHTKSSIMVGLGETRPELHQTFVDLRAVDCDILTIGQYLRPSAEHLPVERYYHPDEFAEMREEALALGFKHVESGPLVRSSYHARDQVPGAEARRAAREAGVAGAAATPIHLVPTIDPEGRVVYRPD
jgi:lipoic acid synthetase